MLNELRNTGHSRRNLHLCIAYSNNLPCHPTLPPLYLRIPHRLDKLHSDTSCATLSIKLIPFPISSPCPWQSILCYALRLLYLRQKHWPLLLQLRPSYYTSILSDLHIALTLISYSYCYLFPIANPSLAHTHSPTFLRVTSLPCKTTYLTPGFVSVHQLTLVPPKLSMSRALGTPNVRFLTAFGHILNHSPPIHTPATAFSAYFATETSLVRLLASAYTRNLHLCDVYACICS